MKIAALIQKIETYPDRLADEGVKIMKEEVPVGKTGELKGSINSEPVDTWTRSVGSSVFHAKCARYGRGPVSPVRKKALSWEDYSGTQTSVHHGVPGQIIITKHAAAAPPNEFTIRTATRLKGKAKSLF